ncbi:hypothetical protein D9M71_526380 [compost metagenome]
MEAHQAFAAGALADFPVAAEQGGIQGLLEGLPGEDVGVAARGDEALLGGTGAGLLDEFVAVQGEALLKVAVEGHPPLDLALGRKVAFADVDAVARPGGVALRRETPLQVGAIGQQGFAQLAAVGGSVDGRLVDPGAGDVVRAAGAAAEQGATQQEGQEGSAHAGVLSGKQSGGEKPLRRRAAAGAYSRTRMPSISTWAPRGRAATPMAARAG